MVSWQEIIQSNIQKKPWPIKPGDIVRVHQEYQDKKGKTHTSIFEGVVLKISSGEGLSKTFTVRRVVDGVGVERIYPMYSPTIKKVEILRRQKVRRAKLYYLRQLSGKKLRLKRKDIDEQTLALLAQKEEEEEPKETAEAKEAKTSEGKKAEAKQQEEEKAEKKEEKTEQKAKEEKGKK